MKTFRSILIASLGVLAIGAAERFDYLVRADFFAGLAGDHAALAHAMKTCDDALAQNPKQPEALVWHGSGLMVMSGWSFRKGDMQQGGELWARGLQEMEAAGTLAPDNLGVLIPRGATLLQVAQFVHEPAEAQKLAQQGVDDYQKVYDIQKPYFDTLSGHQRGELLFGLARGYDRIGQKERAREVFEQLAAVGISSGHEPEAKQWLATGSYTKREISCTGCHSGK